MKIRDFDNGCVVDIDRMSISYAEIRELEEMLLKKKALKKRVALNLKNVEFLSHEFGSFLCDFNKNSRLSLFNISNESLLFLYMTKYDNFVNVYISEDDFLSDKYCLVNRRFKLLKTA